MIPDTKFLGPPILLNEFKVNLRSLNQESFKYADFNFAYSKSSKVVQNILDSFKYENNHKYKLVDVKYLFLEKGWASCMLGWHIDVTTNVNHKEPKDIHHLYFSGAEANTIFLNKDINFDQPITDDLIFVAPENTYIKYSRLHLHSASTAKISGYRLIVRVTETNIIKPINKIIKCEPNKTNLKLGFKIKYE